jgi:putative MATE family efflux protein
MFFRKRHIDIANGPLLSNMLLFALPIMAMNILQLMFNAADMIVVGRFSGKTALAAVGATGSLINLLVNLFMGLSVGTSVIVSQDYGAGRHVDVSRAVHTSMTLSIIGGLAVMVTGIVFCKPLLEMMGTPMDIISLSILYMKIYFLGIPGTMVYNFGSAVLRAIGDSRRPTYYLFMAGVVNVILNLVFVIGFRMGVAGVAWATTISQYLSAVLVVICLYRSHGSIRFIPKQMKISKEKFLPILRVGVPAGLQGALFSISNVMVQSAVNSFGSTMVAGNSAAVNVEGFVSTSMNAYYNAAITFTGQNMGARKYDRIDKIALICILLIMSTWFVIGGATLLFGRQLLSLYSTDAQVIELGMRRLFIMMSFYFLCGIMVVFPGITRAMGYSILPMLVTLVCACLLRIVWLATIFTWNPTPLMLYACYPVTWALAGLGQAAIFLFGRRQVRKQNAPEMEFA